MPNYTVRVTRGYATEYLDFEITARSWSAAKKKAIAQAENALDDFGPSPLPEYYIDPMDDDDESARTEHGRPASP